MVGRPAQVTGMGMGMVGVQRRRNASQGHSARLRGADWIWGVWWAASSGGLGAGVGAVRWLYESAVRAANG
jgi:hypothetical protein